MLSDLNSLFDQFSGFGKNSDDLLSPEKLIEKESFIYVLFLKIRSLFSGRSLEANFKNDLYASFSDYINKKFPDFIDYKKNNLSFGFKNSLTNLNESLFFFKRFLNFKNANDEVLFFNTIISFSIPEFSNLVNQKCDPFVLEQNNDSTVESKELILKTFEKVVLELSDSIKSQMSQVYKDLMWLIDFSKLDFGKFLGIFKSQPSGEEICNFYEAADYFEDLSRVVNTIPDFSQRTVLGLFDFALKRKLIALDSGKSKEEQMTAFINGFNSSINRVHSFPSDVYLKKLGKVIKQDYYWKPQTVSYNSKWFDQICESYRQQVSKKWNFWKKNKVTAEVSAKLKSIYNLDDFPFLPNRPWVQLKTNPVYKLEHTSGYFVWYAQKKHDSVLDILHQLLMEGNFINQENRNEISSSLMMYEDSITVLKDVLPRLVPKGKFGMVFEEIANSKGNLFKADSQVKSMLGYIEGEIRRGTEQLFKSSGTISSFIGAIFEADELRREGKNPINPVCQGLTNLNEIRNPLNNEWKNKLKTAQVTLENCVYFLQRMAEIDAIS